MTQVIQKQNHGLSTELKPGESKEDSITLVNNTDKTLNVKVYPLMQPQPVMAHLLC